MNLYDEFFSVIFEFERHNLGYAVIGGFALAFHDHPRFTDDIDILVKNTDLKKAEELLKHLGYFKSTDPHKFLNKNLKLHRFVKTQKSDYLIVDLLSGKDHFVTAILENTVKAKWEKGNVAVASRDDLIRLKKIRNSDQDKVDIKHLENDQEENKN